MMTIVQRYFVQYMLKKGCIPVKIALAYCRSLPESSVQDITQLKLLILAVNRQISEQNFKISIMICEVTNQELIIFANTKNDAVSRMQLSLSAIELEYFHIIMQEIISSDESRLSYIVVLNITSTLTSTYSRDSGQKVLKKWINGRYFVHEDGYVYLGPRLILEFTTYLKSHRPDQLCKLCSELVFIGKRCGMCDRILHSYCLEKYLASQKKCPSCKGTWVERTNDFDLPTTQELTNLQSHYTEESMDMDAESQDSQEPVPSTSSGLLTEGTVRRSSRKRLS